MKRSATVSDRFQTVIPAGIREALKLRPGDKVIFSLDAKGRAVVERAPSRKEAREHWVKSALERYAEDGPERPWGELTNEDFRD